MKDVKAGKAATAILWLLLCAVGALAAVSTIFVEALADLRAWQAAAGTAAALGLCGGLFLLPAGISIDRAIARLRAHVEGAGERSVPFRGPRWLRPLTQAVSGAVDQLLQREQALKSQIRDLEVRHRVAEAERHQIEEVLHSLRDGVLVTDAFNEIVMANQTAAEILGFTVEGSIHRPIDQVISDGLVRRLIGDTRHNANFAERRHVEHELNPGPATGPGTRAYDVSLTCVENLNHEVGGVVTILHDVTREREISQMKSDFVSKASHELRTPLSSIRAYVEMLVDGEALDETSRHEFYRIIQNETDRLSRLIDNMLNISRLEAGIVQIERVAVDLHAVIAKAVETLEPHAREKKIGLSSRPAPVNLSVQGDFDMLFQVVLNLGSNAIKYTPEGGRVTISADSDNLTRSVVVTVADTGLGIPPDDLPRLFEKFFRVENYKRVAKGTGLGLNLCKNIVEKVHQGQIGVESRLGMGSRFWFSIPMQYAGTTV